MQHQVDACRAFVKDRDAATIHSAALAGDSTRSAQRYGRRVRLQSPDLSPQEARRWLAARFVHDDSSPWSRLPHSTVRTTAY